MAITGRTSEECVAVFRDHLAGLIAATVTTTYPITKKVEGDRIILGFRQGRLVGVPLDTRFGRLFFYLSQSLRTVKLPDGNQRLKTRQYWYRLQQEPSPASQAVLRWEYDAETDRDAHARHHMQMPAEIALGEGSLDMNKAHLPTGWVTIEEVIRFLIVDLEVRPPCGEDWADRLHVSEDRFFQEFTSKREPALD